MRYAHAGLCGREHNSFVTVAVLYEEDKMAEGGSGGIGILGVIVGAIIVVGIGFFFLQGGMKGGGASKPSVTIQTPAAPSSK